jgi:predicted exporter
VAAVLGLGVVAGLYRLQPDDSLRQLQSSPAALVADQRELSELLGLPSANQFFLVTGATTDEVLAREEALKEKLRALVSRQQLSGYRALTDWLPSSARQSEDSRLVQQAEAAVVARVNATLGEALQQPASAGGPLLLDRWLASPVASANARDLWLGRIDTPDSRTATYGSVVIPRGIHDGSALPALAAAAVGLPGVAWVDKASDMAGMLGSYRQSMSWLLLAGHVLVFAILALRYGRRAWRAYLPTALATLIAVATLGVTGIPLQLFNVLALLLLLGVGVDYGIFLLEHHSDGPSWLAVVLGSTSTLLAFGLLGLSSTPALHAFGVTLGVGLLAVALLSPVFRADPTDFHHRESP